MSVLKDIRRVYAGLDAGRIRDAASLEINAGIMANDGAGYRRLQDLLVPLAADNEVRERALRAIRPVEGPPQPFDFVLCEPGVPVPPNGYLFEPGDDSSASLIGAIVADRPHLETALARTFPLFRPVVANRIVSRVARENALFSLVTALPNVVPGLLELPWAVGEFATDTAFLTMNQVRMALMLAAAHDRPMGYREQKTEILGIVAGAFGWRAIARELAGKIPLGGGLIPKAAVAFAGTWVVGLGLERLNRTGSGFSGREEREAYADAFARARDTVRRIAPDLHRNDHIAAPA